MIRRCSLLAKYLRGSSSIKKKQETALKTKTFPRTKRLSETKKTKWKKTLAEFMPKLGI